MVAGPIRGPSGKVVVEPVSPSDLPATVLDLVGLDRVNRSREVLGRSAGPPRRGTHARLRAVTHGAGTTRIAHESGPRTGREGPMKSMRSPGACTTSGGRTARSSMPRSDPEAPPIIPRPRRFSRFRRPAIHDPAGTEGQPFVRRTTPADRARRERCLHPLPWVVSRPSPSCVGRWTRDCPDLAGHGGARPADRSPTARCAMSRVCTVAEIGCEVLSSGNAIAPDRVVDHGGGDPAHQAPRSTSCPTAPAAESRSNASPAAARRRLDHARR